MISFDYKTKKELKANIGHNMKHKIEINIDSEDIKILENIINGQCHTLMGSLDLEDAVVLCLISQILREVNRLDK